MMENVDTQFFEKAPGKGISCRPTCSYTFMHIFIIIIDYDHLRYTYVEFRAGVMRWFIVMNYFIHSFMYTYYTLRAMKIHVPKVVAMIITTMQIAQVSWPPGNQKSRDCLCAA